MYATISFVIAGIFGMMSVAFLALIVAAPDKFVLLFTLTMVALIAGFANLKGPRRYVKNLFVGKQLYASIALITSILLALYFSLV